MEQMGGKPPEALPPSRAAFPRAIATGVLCGLLFFGAMFESHADTLSNWDVITLWPSMVILIGPFTLVAWSIVAGPSRRAQRFFFARRIIQGHCALAGLISVLGFLSLAIRTGPPFGLVVGLLSLIAVVIDFVLLGLTPRAPSDFGTLRIFRRGILALGGGSLVGASIWPLAIAGLVVLQAELIAVGRPYCIQVASDIYGHYRAVTSVSELNGLKMHSPWYAGNTSDYQNAFHAVLMVATGDADASGGHWARWNWSHMQARFAPISERSASALRLDKSLACKPQPHFAVQLPIMASR